MSGSNRIKWSHHMSDTLSIRLSWIHASAKSIMTRQPHPCLFCLQTSYMLLCVCVSPFKKNSYFTHPFLKCYTNGDALLWHSDLLPGSSDWWITIVYMNSHGETLWDDNYTCGSTWWTFASSQNKKPKQLVCLKLFCWTFNNKYHKIDIYCGQTKWASQLVL